MNQPSLAVSSFENLSEDPAQSYFCRGFVEDLIADLSRFSDLTVLAQPAPEVVQQADFVLDGSLRRAGDRLRVTAQLRLGGETEVIWAAKFDERAAELFDIEDTITEQVVAAVSSRINARLLAASKRKPKTELLAFEHWLQGVDHLRQGTVAADHHARKLFQQALATDAGFARAELGLSLTYFNEWSCQLWQAWDENERNAFEHAQRAAELDPEDHYAQMVLGRVLLFRREFTRAEEHARRSLALNANDADCLVQIAMSLAFLGEPAQAKEVFTRAQRLNPQHAPWYYAYAGIVAFADGDFEWGLSCASKLPIDIMVDLPAYMAVGYHHAGQHDLARQYLEQYLTQFSAKIVIGREAEPGEALRWLQHVNPWKRAADEARLLDGVKAVSQSHGAPPALSPSADRNAFRKVGSLWQMSYAGHDVWLPHLKGFVDIRTLLENRGEEIHCTQLMGSIDSSSDDTAIDDAAKLAYKQRAATLREELAEAENNHDEGRAERARKELEQLLAHLGSALGKGGKARKLAAPSERARSAVTQRLRAAVKRVHASHGELGQHLDEAIQTGTYCAYRPSAAIEWTL